MKRALLAAALAAATTPYAFNPAAAQPDAAGLHLLVTLERLAAPAAKAGAPVFTRNASVSVAGRLQIVSNDLTGPLFCSLFFGYFDSNTSQFHLEVATRRVAVTGRSGICNMTVPFRWQNVTADGNVGIFVEVGNAEGSIGPATVAPPTMRGLQFFGPSLPLALEGEDVHITFATRI